VGRCQKFPIGSRVNVNPINDEPFVATIINYMRKMYIVITDGEQANTFVVPSDCLSFAVTLSDMKASVEDLVVL